jgi:hypothetical protein
VVSRVVHDAVRLVASNVEIDFASGLLTLRQIRGVDALGCRNLVQGSVRVAAWGTCVQIRHDRGDIAVYGFIGGSSFPESARYGVGDGVSAWFEIADGPSLNNIAVDKRCLGAQSVATDLGAFIGRGRRCASDPDDSRRNKGGCGGKCGGRAVVFQRGSLLYRLYHPKSGLCGGLADHGGSSGQ